MTIKDGDWTLINYEPRSGRTVWSYFDGEKTVFRTDYPVEATIAENQAVRNIAQKAWTGDWHRIASVPLNVYFEQLHPLDGDEKAMSRWLNDSDNRAFRTKEGIV